ncbi:hypothetical protein F3J11_03755 [Burkholderia sp. Cy-647]|nr:hypothetical protein [Burkholderia sp. Tr-860]NIF61819.1 hypothetical protein [Burkholderia sp. Cy-647]NIF96943.1 hypothetical protein [Burkholderia sp. Ax-1720]
MRCIRRVAKRDQEAREAIVMTTPHHRDDYVPSQAGRRRFVFGMLSLASLSVVDLWTEVHASSATDHAGLDRFMQVSRLVSPRAADPATGAALYQALRERERGFDTNLQALAERIAARPGIDVDTLAADLDRSRLGALRQTLNAVTSAWYLGVVGFRTYAYQTALMFGVVADVLSPPSYVRRGPLYWATSRVLPAA